MTKSATLQRIRITPELKVRLERLAQDDRRTVSDYVRLVLEQHVKSAECFGELASEDKAPSLKIAGPAIDVNVSGPFPISKPMSFAPLVWSDENEQKEC